MNPDSSIKAYQELSKIYSAIEPPTWVLLLAQACRKKDSQVLVKREFELNFPLVVH